MLIKRYRAAVIAAAAILVSSTVMYAAGNWSTLPVIGSASYCASTVTGTGSLGGITGQGQGSTGSICAQTVPAGPSVVTGTEVVPADLNNPALTPSALGGQPQTALLSMASLNALPIYVFNVLTAAQNTLVASPTVGGYNFDAASTISAVTITLPATPIDGQQFAVSSDQTITTLLLTTVVGAPGGAAAPTIKQAPTVVTVSTTAAYGYRLMYNQLRNQWMRLQ